MNDFGIIKEREKKFFFLEFFKYLFDSMIVWKKDDLGIYLFDDFKGKKVVGEFNISYMCLVEKYGVKLVIYDNVMND